jgi:hypothetical protein
MGSPWSPPYSLRTFELFLLLFPDVLQLGNRRTGEHVHGHVAAPGKRRLELLQHQEDLAVVGAGIVLPLDINRAGLSPSETALTRVSMRP